MPGASAARPCSSFLLVGCLCSKVGVRPFVYLSCSEEFSAGIFAFVQVCLFESVVLSLVDRVRANMRL